jgi:hypothetical protein
VRALRSEYQWHVPWQRCRLGSRITDYISLGVVAKFFPLEKVREVLKETGRASAICQCNGVVYYVIAVTLYMRSS